MPISPGGGPCAESVPTATSNGHPVFLPYLPEAATAYVGGDTGVGRLPDPAVSRALRVVVRGRKSPPPLFTDDVPG